MATVRNNLLVHRSVNIVVYYVALFGACAIDIKSTGCTKAGLLVEEIGIPTIHVFGKI